MLFGEGFTWFDFGFAVFLLLCLYAVIEDLKNMNARSKLLEDLELEEEESERKDTC